MKRSRVLFLLGVLLAVEARSGVARGRKPTAARKHSTRNGPIQRYGPKWRGNSPALKAQARLPRTNAPSTLRNNSTGVNSTKIDCPCLHNHTGDGNQNSTFSHARTPRSQNRSDRTSGVHQLPRNFGGPELPPDEKPFKLRWPSPAPQPARTSWPTMPTESTPTTSSQVSETNIYGTDPVPRAKQRVQKSPSTSDHGGTRYTPEPETVPQNSFSSSGARSSPSHSHENWRGTSNRPRLSNGNGLSGSLGFLRHHRGDNADPTKNHQNRTKPELSQDIIPSQLSIPKMPLGLERANSSTAPADKGTEPPTSSSVSLNPEDKNGLAKETELPTNEENGQEIDPTMANNTVGTAPQCTPCTGPGTNSTCPNPSEVCRLLPRVGKFEISAERNPVGTFFCSVVVGLSMPCGLRTTPDGSECSVCKEGYSCRVLDDAKFSRERVPVCAPIIS